jgi:hypothetical protein
MAALHPFFREALHPFRTTRPTHVCLRALFDHNCIFGFLTYLYQDISNDIILYLLQHIGGVITYVDFAI